MKRRKGTLAGTQGGPDAEAAQAWTAATPETRWMVYVTGICRARYPVESGTWSGQRSATT